MEDPCKDAPEDSLVNFRNNPKRVCCPDTEGQPQTLPAGSGNLVLIPERPYIFRYSHTDDDGTSPFVFEANGQMLNGAFKISPQGKSSSLATMFRTGLGDLPYSNIALPQTTTNGQQAVRDPLPQNPVSVPYKSSKQITFQTAQCFTRHG